VRWFLMKGIGHKIFRWTVIIIVYGVLFLVGMMMMFIFASCRPIMLDYGQGVDVQYINRAVDMRESKFIEKEIYESTTPPAEEDDTIDYSSDDAYWREWSDWQDIKNGDESQFGTLKEFENIWMSQGRK
jgi:hypothetical protein